MGNITFANFASILDSYPDTKFCSLFFSSGPYLADFPAHANENVTSGILEREL